MEKSSKHRHSRNRNKIDGQSKDNFAYEDESRFNDLPGEVSNASSFPHGDAMPARKVDTTWEHLVKKKRVTRQSSFGPTENHTLGLDEDPEEMSGKIPYDPKQSRLNKKLISHFSHLAKRNQDDDEVNLDLIEDLLKRGADINCKDKHGQGLVHEAARAWHSDIMLFLLQHKANVNMTDSFGRTALHIAAAVDYPEMVQLLYENGGRIEATTKTENQTPLHFAARNDAVASMKVLIKLGAEIEAKDYKGRTPVFVAAELDRSETAKFLVDINADVTVIDRDGQICMTHMITKMGPVARTALDQFHRKERANRKQYYYLSLLESTTTSKYSNESLAKTPLEVIVKYRQLDLIMHPVISRLIEVKWKQFGRKVAFQTLFTNVIFVLIWTILGVGYPWQIRYIYTFPQDWWRVLLLLLGCLATIYYVIGEVMEVLSSRKKFHTWKKWRENLLDKDMEFCHPKWPAEKKYLKREMDTLDEMLPYYFQDFWNYFDWSVYFLIFLVVILHIVDVALTNRVPPCCSFTEPCNNFSAEVCDDGFVNNASLSVWNNRIFVITIIFLWLRLMKFTRAFRFFGPFIVMLGNLVWDIVRFLYLYSEFYIPYACAFWMIFGKVGTISTMSTVDQMLFALFRITLVDEYEFPEMQAYDVVMAYILVGTFLGISAILCLNLFIALLSDTFQRVYDNAKANAAMQQAALMLSFEENLSKRSRKRFKKYIDDKCSPESKYYDDDLTVAQDADLKKVTIQIKEQMDELLEYVHQAETEKSLALGYHENPHLASVEDGRPHHGHHKAADGSDFRSPRDGRLKSRPSARLTDVMGLSTQSFAYLKSRDGGSSSESSPVSLKLTDVTSRLQRLQVSQEAQQDSYKRLRRDMNEMKEMLSLLVHGNVQVDGMKRTQASPPSQNFLQQQPLTASPGPKQLGGRTLSPQEEANRLVSGGLPTIPSENKTTSERFDHIGSSPIFVSTSTNQAERLGIKPSPPGPRIELFSLPRSVPIPTERNFVQEFELPSFPDSNATLPGDRNAEVVITDPNESSSSSTSDSSSV